jgi:hypothetical protein
MRRFLYQLPGVYDKKNIKMVIVVFISYIKNYLFSNINEP